MIGFLYKYRVMKIILRCRHRFPYVKARGDHFLYLPAFKHGGKTTHMVLSTQTPQDMASGALLTLAENLGYVYTVEKMSDSNWKWIAHKTQFSSEDWLWGVAGSELGAELKAVDKICRQEDIL